MIGAFPSAMPPPDRLGRRIAGVDALSSASHFCTSVKHLVPHRSFSPESGISLLRSTIRISQIQLCGAAATRGIHHLSSAAVRTDDLYQRLEVSQQDNGQEFPGEWATSAKTLDGNVRFFPPGADPLRSTFEPLADPPAEQLVPYVRPEFLHDVKGRIDSDLLAPFVHRFSQASVRSWVVDIGNTGGNGVSCQL
jgi:hypothetical protein